MADKDSELLLVLEESVEDFMAQARVFLEAQEGKNHLLMGICASVEAGLTPAKGALFTTIVKERSVFTVAVRTDHQNLVLSEGDQESIGAIAREFANRKIHLPGVVGPADEAEFFAQEWSRLTGVSALLAREQGVFQISRLNFPAKRVGIFRAAFENETQLMADWMGEFMSEANPHEIQEPSKILEGAKTRIRARELYVLEVEGKVVSMAGIAGRTPHGIRVNYVFTPRDLRRKGYSRSCVACLAHQQLTSGRKWCFLYADLKNTGAVKLYQDLGFEQVDKSRHYVFG